MNVNIVIKKKLFFSDANIIKNNRNEYSRIDDDLFARALPYCSASLRGSLLDFSFTIEQENVNLIFLRDGN
jgi:hypothetical protein